MLLAGVLAGCGKAPPPPIVEAGGVVRLDGKPLKKVEVRFIPVIEYGPEYVAVGVTDDAGRFKLTCKGQPGACACDNQVLVMEAELPSHLKGENAQRELAVYLAALGPRPPERYTNLASSNLSVKVEAGKTDYALDLTR
jgi:hypothetical protein